MKLNVKSVLIAGFLTAFFLLGVVSAQSPAPTANEPKNEQLQKRLEERKNNLATRLTDFQKQQVSAGCKAAQAKIELAQEKVNGKPQERAQRYASTLENLTRLSVKLKTKEIDTATLDTQIAELKTLVENHSTALNEFGQQLGDMVDMDCEADPEAFKATLDQAREDRKGITQHSADVKNFLATKIKPTLLAIREQVAESTTGGNG